MNALLLTIGALLNGPSVVGTVGTVDVIDTSSCVSTAAADERVSIARQRVTREFQSAAAARALLVRDNLHVFDAAPALPLADLDEQEFLSERAELRAARAELAGAEESLVRAPCGRHNPQSGMDRDQGTTLELTMELPASLLRPLQQGIAGKP